MKFPGYRFLSFSCFTLVLSLLGLSEAHANYPTTSDGAVADGVTDDTANLQEALTYCSDNNLVCEIPAGKTHYVTGPLFIWGGASLQSSAGGGIKLNDTGNAAYMINLGISAKTNGTTNYLEDKFTGTIEHVVFTISGGSGGRILYFWRTEGATISDNTFNVGPYAYSATSSGNNNNWVLNGGGSGVLIRKDIAIVDNAVVASSGAAGFEGIGLNQFDGALIQGNVVTGVGDDPIGIHFSKNIDILSNTLRSVDGRIFVSSSQSVEIADNTHIRIPARTNGSFYRGIALIYVGFENPGEDNTLSAPQYPDDYIDIHDNRLYYPAGSIDISGGAISVFGARHTTIADNIVVNDKSSPTNYAVYVSAQVFRKYEKDGSGNFIYVNGARVPIPEATAWDDPTDDDDGFFGNPKYNYARTYDVTIDGNVSGSTVGVGAPLNFVMTGNCDTHVGTVTLTDNVAPVYQNFFDIYQAQCTAQPTLIATDSGHPNVTSSTSYPDTDSDGWPDMFDNCPSIANADQFDLDGNAVGDACQHGLTAEYHDVSTLINDPVLSRIDPAIDFNWGFSSPGLDVPADYFSVHWTGRVVAPVTGTYQFCVLGDDGIRLWLDETLILDFWEPQDSVTNCANVALTAGQSAPIELNFFDHEEEAIVKLTWSYPGQTTQVIPSSVLYAR